MQITDKIWNFSGLVRIGPRKTCLGRDAIDHGGIIRGTFYNHIYRSNGENSVYAIRDRQLSEEIKRIFEENDSILGAAKIAAIIRQGGTPVSEEKVRKLMRAMGLRVANVTFDSVRVVNENYGRIRTA